MLFYNELSGTIGVVTVTAFGHEAEDLETTTPLTSLGTTCRNPKGDANEDGVINADDGSLISATVGNNGLAPAMGCSKNACGPDTCDDCAWLAADVDGNGKVNLDDSDAVALMYNSCPDNECACPAGMEWTGTKCAPCRQERRRPVRCSLRRRGDPTSSS